MEYRSKAFPPNTMTISFPEAFRSFNSRRAFFFLYIHERHLLCSRKFRQSNIFVPPFFVSFFFILVLFDKIATKTCQTSLISYKKQFLYLNWYLKCLYMLQRRKMRKTKFRTYVIYFLVVNSKKQRISTNFVF